jgi:CubicO group peptidase (beta-lactamase class C family)
MRHYQTIRLNCRCRFAHSLARLNMTPSFHSRFLSALLAVVSIASSTALAAEPSHATPSETWPTATLEEVGIDSAPLVEMFDFIRERQIPVHSIQLVRRGRLVLDAYFYPYDGRTRHDVASVTKSITSTLVGLAIERGYIRDVQQPVLDFFPGRTVAGLDARKRKQTLEHLLTMQSGWDCGVPLGTPTINADRQLAEMRRRNDWAQFALDLPMTSEPGTRFLYCNANCHLLSALLTRVTGTNALAFARRELFEPLGIRDTAWPADPQGNNFGWGDLQLHPRDMARLGQLCLERGRWAGRQIIPEAWLRTATRAHVERTGGKDHYGYYWWVSAQLPGLFEAVGRGGQRITVWPDKELVLVYTGGGFEPGDLASFILKSLNAVKSDKSDQPLPANAAANARLRDKLAAATRPLAPQPVPELPAMAARISGKTYTLTANELDLATLTLQFNKSSEATLRFTRLGQELGCPVGLDGVERFSADKLVELPFACKGRWLNADTFLLELDRVAGISLYRFKLTFADEGKSVTIALSERTGLGEETIRGKH